MSFCSEKKNLSLSLRYCIVSHLMYERSGERGPPSLLTNPFLVRCSTSPIFIWHERPFLIAPPPLFDSGHPFPPIEVMLLAPESRGRSSGPEGQMWHVSDYVRTYVSCVAAERLSGPRASVFGGRGWMDGWVEGGGGGGRAELIKCLSNSWINTHTRQGEIGDFSLSLSLSLSPPPHPIRAICARTPLEALRACLSL